MQSEMQGLNMYAIKTVYVSLQNCYHLGHWLATALLFRTLFNTYYSVPVRSVYYPLADMITWAVRISGLIGNRWFLVSGTISVGLELASKERLNIRYNRECNLKCKA